MSDPFKTGHPGTAHTFLGQYHEGRKVFRDRFELVRFIGEGGMGVVWEAVETATGERRALKFFKPEFLESSGMRARKEAEAGRKLKHPNIIRTYEFLEEGGEGALVLEFVDGKHLGVWLGRQEAECFEPSEIAVWVDQLCEALTHAHSPEPPQVIHRDVKPQNILIQDSDRSVRLGDFGISRIVQQTILATKGTILQRHGEATTHGYSMGFASPEQVRQESAGLPADDVYSVGATPFYLLTGTFCYTNATEAREDDPPLVSQRRKQLRRGKEEIPKSWDRTIAACLASEPSWRPKEVALIPRMLRGEVKAKPRRRRKQKTGLILALAVLCGLVALGTLGYMFWDQGEQKKLRDLELSVTEAYENQDFAAAKDLLEANPKIPAKYFRRQVEAMRLPWPIVVTPTDTTVFIGDEERPATIDNGMVSDLPVGEFEVRLVRKGYNPLIQKIRLGDPAHSPPSTLTLIRSEELLELSSDPPGQEYEVTSVSLEVPGPLVHRAGHTPASEKLPTGAYSVVLRRKGWPDLAESVTVTQESGPQSVTHAFREGSIRFTSRQAGAEAFFKDGTPLGRITEPGTAVESRSLPTGTYKVVGRLNGQPDREIEVNVLGPGSPVELDWELGRLALKSNLNDVTWVGSDGKMWDPQERELPAGKYAITARRPPLADVTRNVEVKAEESLEERFEFVYSVARIEGGPAEAEVFEGEKRVARGLPFEIGPVARGETREYSIRAPGFATKSVRLVLDREKISERVQLESLPEGTIRITGYPEGATIRMIQERTDLDLRIPAPKDGWTSAMMEAPAVVRFEVSHPGYEPMSQDVSVRAGEEIPVEFHLKPVKYRYRLAVQPANAEIWLGNAKRTPDDSGVYVSEWVGATSEVVYLVKAPGFMTQKVILHGRLGETVEPGTLVALKRDQRDYMDIAPLPIAKKAIDHIVKFETGGRSYYDAKLQHPQWPGYESGVTIGISYDLGYYTVEQIRADWEEVVSRKELAALASVQGVRGSSAKYSASKISSDVTISWDEAMLVFERSTLPHWSRLTSYAYVLGRGELPPLCNGALIGNAFKRGTSMSPEGRLREKFLVMQAIRERNWSAIPDLLRAQGRYFPGTNGEFGLQTLFSEEAELFEEGLREMKDGRFPPVSQVFEDFSSGKERSYYRTEVVGPHHPIWTIGELHPSVVARKNRILGIGLEGEQRDTIRAGVLYAASAAAHKANALGYHFQITSGNRWGVSTSPNHGQDGSLGDSVDFVITTEPGGEGQFLKGAKAMQQTYDILACAAVAAAKDREKPGIGVGWGRSNGGGTTLRWMMGNEEPPIWQTYGLTQIRVIRISSGLSVTTPKGESSPTPRTPNMRTTTMESYQTPE